MLLSKFVNLRLSFSIGLLLLYQIPSVAQQNIKPLEGFVDMHTHPRNDLAFGTELFYGCPYGNIEEALYNCNGYHGGYGLFDNRQGNVFRNKLVEEGESQYCKNGEHVRAGYPNFISW